MCSSFRGVVVATILIFGLFSSRYAIASPAWEKVYTTTSEALNHVFPTATHVSSRNITVPFHHEPITMYHAFQNDVDLGTAYVINEKGKYRPITMFIHLTPSQVLGEIIVMVYREKIGGSVRKRRFLKQFIGKDKSHPIKVNQDIDGITGATVSSWSVARASKKVLLLADETQNKVHL